jgi:hypothetical protein
VGDVVTEPTLDELLAVLAAVEAYGRKRRYVEDMPRHLAELAESVERVRAVTRELPAPSSGTVGEHVSSLEWRGGVSS